MADEVRPEDRRHLLDLYEGEIRFLDLEIGRLLRLIEAAGRRDETALLLTADHGEEFFEHGWLGHANTLSRLVLEIPMIVVVPGGPAGRLRDDAATLLDVYPTLLALAGADPGASAGRDLLRTDGTGPVIAEVSYDTRPLIGKTTTEERAHRQLAVLRAVRQGDWQLVADVLTGEVRLFDLASDRREAHDVAAENPAVLERLSGALREWEETVHPAARSPAAIDEETRESLESLGYTR